MTRIAIVEDDEVLRESYTEIMSDNGFSVDSYADKESAIAGLQNNLPELVILDVTLGSDRDAGFQICTELRHQSESLPIIFLTAHDSDIDKISGLRLGADDYLTKQSISHDYLLARVDALLRRYKIISNQVTQQSQVESETIEQDDLVLDMNRYTASWKGKTVDLTLTCFWLIHALVKHPGHIKTHDQLMESANLVVQPNTVTAYIKSIRERFKVIDPDFNAIRSERSLGYRWLIG